jgi:hypothetical protein
MRRKLIKQDAFDSIIKESATTAERELAEAANVLSRALNKGPMSLRCFTEATVVYETMDNTYVHAGYQIDNGHVTFNNIEELVIDETTRRDKMRGLLSSMIDHVLSDDHTKAKGLFESYLSMVQWNKNEGKISKKHKTNLQESHRQAVLSEAVGTAGREVKQAYSVARNVLDYVDFMKHGPALNESISKRDEKGNVTDIRIPTCEARNEGRVKKLGYTVTNAENHDVRKSVPSLVHEQAFCKAIADLKRQNAFSDQHGLEEALDNIVQKYPQVLMVTQGELSAIVGEALSQVGVANYDDETCDFIAEGILRRAHGAYTERVNQILHLAAAPKVAEGNDPYVHFQKVAEIFFPTLDEQFGLERKAYSDLYEVLEGVWKQAERRGDTALQHQAGQQLNDLASVLNGEVRPDIQTIEESASWLMRLIEANVEGSSSTWSVSNKPHMTINGDHPDMAKKAKVGAVPGAYSGDWGDEAPAIGQDDMSYKGGKHSKKMRNDSWGQEGGKETFPNLKNPYVPKPFGDYTMKGEKGIDKEATGQHWSTWSTSDTWPDLKNPYVPKEVVGTGGKGYKMKNGKETDLVVDR